MELPEGFIRSIEQLLPGDYEALLQSLNEPAHTSVRINPGKDAPSFESAEAVPWCNSGRYLPQRPTFTLDPKFHAGTYYVQEASSMFLDHMIRNLVSPVHTLNVLDLCAAPGGKSTLLATCVSRSSLIVSNEVIRSRAGILSENVVKWGYANTMVTSNDPRDFARAEGLFDLVVVDAPCSGEGLFRKDPRAVVEWSPSSVSLCAQRQRRILSDVWPSLKENGLLIYCTCTYNRVENEDNMLWFADNHPVEFATVEVDPAWGVTEVRDDAVTGWRFFPHRLRGEGFFISAFRKAEAVRSRTQRTRRSTISPVGKLKEKITPWLTDPHSFEFVQYRENILALPAERSDDFVTLASLFHIVNLGTRMGTVRHDKITPEHPLALSVHLNRDFFPTVELTDQEALAYLRKESIHPNAGARGIALVTFDGAPLGWINQLGNRANNLYPTDWRIRM